VGLQGVNAILRTSRRKATGSAEPGAERELIAPNAQSQKGGDFLVDVAKELHVWVDRSLAFFQSFFRSVLIS